MEMVFSVKGLSESTQPRLLHGCYTGVMNVKRMCRVCGLVVLLITGVASGQSLREFRGTFRYMADAATFESCGGLSWPVAMQAGYLALERRYLQQASGGDAVFVRVQGRLLVQPNMEGRPREFLEVTEVLELLPNRGSNACASLGVMSAQPALYEGHWQLSGLTGVLLTDVARLPYLMFRRDGGALQMRGYAGCNQVRAPYVTQGQQLLIGNMATTKMACFGKQGQLEGALLRVLTDANAFDISGQTLTLLAGDEALARFIFQRETPSQ